MMPGFQTLLHPFIDVSITFPPETNYYSSTKEIDDLSGTIYWGVAFDDGLVGTLGLGGHPNPPHPGFLIWCVRGGQASDGNSHYGGL